jgi:hypothetical protein
MLLASVAAHVPGLVGWALSPSRGLDTQFLFVLSIAVVHIWVVTWAGRTISVRKPSLGLVVVAAQATAVFAVEAWLVWKLVAHPAVRYDPYLLDLRLAFVPLWAVAVGCGAFVLASLVSSIVRR